MGRKRKKAEMKPFCYYCGRGFESESVLLNHQKSRHFKCDHCSRRMITAHALMNHMFQVHKETYTKVKNAKPGRDSVELPIFGMQGVPPEVIAERQARLAAGQKDDEGGPAGDDEKDDDKDDAEEPAPKKPSAAGPPAADSTAAGGASAPPTLPGRGPLGVPPVAGLPGMPPVMPGMPPVMPGLPGMPPVMPGFPPMMFNPMGMGRGILPGAGGPAAGYGQPGAPPVGFPGMGRGVPPPQMPSQVPGYPGYPPQPGLPQAPVPATAPHPHQPHQHPAPLGAHSVAASAPAPAAAPQGSKKVSGTLEGEGAVQFVFKDPQGLSMEERRAEMSKYSFTDPKVSALSDSIHARLSALQQRR